MSELEPEDGVVTGAGERILGVPWAVLAVKIKVAQGDGVFCQGMLESQKGCG